MPHREQQAEQIDFCDEDDDRDEGVCPECEGDGGDKWNDYCTPCPTCDGAGRLY